MLNVPRASFRTFGNPPRFAKGKWEEIQIISRSCHSKPQQHGKRHEFQEGGKEGTREDSKREEIRKERQETRLSIDGLVFLSKNWDILPAVGIEIILKKPSFGKPQRIAKANR